MSQIRDGNQIMIRNEITLAFSTLLLAMSVSFCVAKTTDAQIPENNILWETSDRDISLKMTMLKPGEGALKFYSGRTLLRDFRPGLYPLNVYKLSDDNLLTVWQHVDGLRHFYVFSYKNKSVVSVLEDTSRLDAELVTYFLSSKKFGDGRLFTQAIIVAKCGDGGRLIDDKFKPVDALVYTWNSKQSKYSAVKVKWAQRMEAVAAH